MEFSVNPFVWRFMYDEETANPGFEGFFRGIISNGLNCLFYWCDIDKKTHIYSSMEEMFLNGEEECSYDSCEANDEILCKFLNKLDDMGMEEFFCGEESPIRTMKFLSRDEWRKIEKDYEVCGDLAIPNEFLEWNLQ